MNIQVLVATMNQKDHSLIQKMNIQSDAIVGNQCDYNSIEQFEWNKHKIKYLNFNERGVGLNRNNTLLRATSDICLFADDDLVYKNNYVESVLDAFNSYPEADVIIFNLEETNTNRYLITKPSRVWYHNYLRYGTARIAIKLDSIRNNGVYFNQCFGGGAEYRHGEDNLFLTDCLKKGMVIYAVPVTIATLKADRESTWNVGFDDKYFKDQGVLYKHISKRFWKLLCFQDAVRHQKLYEKKWYDSYSRMI